MTRAMEKLYLTYAEIRKFQGNENYRKASRFLSEMPTELLHHVRVKTKVSQPISVSPIKQRREYSFITDTDSEYKLGQRVSHKKFGEGVIVNCEGHGAQTRIQVRFKRHGIKWLVASFAKLEAIV